MTNSDKAILAGILGIVLFAGVGIGALVSRGFAPAQTQMTFAAAADQVFLDTDATPPTTGIKTAGPLADTVIVSTTTGRVWLEISNISTSSPGQVLYCNTNDRPVTIGQGIPVFASSTRVISNLQGSIRCKYAVASSSVTYLEK